MFKWSLRHVLPSRMSYLEEVKLGKSLDRYKVALMWRVDKWGNAYTMKELLVFKKVRKYYV